MAAKRYELHGNESEHDLAVPNRAYWLVDTDAELPTTGIIEGDFAYSKQSPGKFYKRTVSAWTELAAGGGGGGVAKESHVALSLSGTEVAF